MKIVFLTGAGLSAESGLPTFRGAGGLWNGHNATELATPEAFAANPDLVHEFYNFRRRQLLAPEIKPNAAHDAIAQLQNNLPSGIVNIVTQNVDNLHERAGANNVLHMHGELLKARCLDTGDVFEWTSDLNTQTPHPKQVNRAGRLRPHIVWFGESIAALPEAISMVKSASWLITVGSSGVVWPAAGLAEYSTKNCRRSLINLEPAANQGLFEDCRTGAASQLVPEICREILAEWERQQ
ncbi:MAG: NAD-dependent deacylase [Pirellulaceae bacterium]